VLLTRTDVAEICRCTMKGSGGAHTSRQSRSCEPAVLSEPRTAITQLTRLRWVSGLPLATRCPRGVGAAAVRIPITPGWEGPGPICHTLIGLFA
jgi:hypothetical protein